MRTTYDMNYGQKKVVVIKNNTMKHIDYKKSIGGIISVVISNYIKGELYGWDKVQSHTMICN